MDWTSKAERNRWSNSRWRSRLLWFVTGMFTAMLLVPIILWFAAPALLAHRSEWPLERASSRWAMS